MFVNIYPEECERNSFGCVQYIYDAECLHTVVLNLANEWQLLQHSVLT